MADVLEVEDLGIAFPSERGETAVVSGVSFRVGEGERVALVGESGSGKTLSALSVLRLLPPSARITGGRVLLKGRDVLTMPDRELRAARGRDAAVVFQEPQTALNPVLTVGYQIAEGIHAHESVTKREALARAEELLGLVGLPDPRRRLDDYPHQFSGGMRQRAMIAMALACRPSLLIADEPTTALDVTVQAQVLDLLYELGERFKMAVLLITHDLGVVARFAERVYVMYAGRVLEEADVHTLFARPGHPYTRGLLKSLPRLERRERRLAAIPGTVPSPSALPPGCAFAPRCPHVVPPCTVAVPALEPRGPGRAVRCILREEAP